jgi:uncharacterized membrane protein YgcG
MRVLLALALAAVAWMLRRYLPIAALFGGRRREQQYAVLTVGPGGARLDPNARALTTNVGLPDRPPSRRRNDRTDTTIWGGDIGGGGGGGSSSDGGGSSSGGGGATGSW